MYIIAGKKSASWQLVAVVQGAKNDAKDVKMSKSSLNQRKYLSKRLVWFFGCRRYWIFFWVRYILDVASSIKNCCYPSHTWYSSFRNCFSLKRSFSWKMLIIYMYVHTYMHRPEFLHANESLKPTSSLSLTKECNTRKQLIGLAIGMSHNIQTLGRTDRQINGWIAEISALIGGQKCNPPPLFRNYDRQPDRPTHQPTKRRTWGVIGRLHFQ